MEKPGQYPITLVTAYFDLGRKQTRYSGNPYPGWIRNFLPFVRWPLVIFCDEQSLDMLKEARGDKPAVYHVIRLQEFVVYPYRALCERLESDGGTSAEYGLVWNEKCNFLRRALSENSFGSEMFYWCDIGMFRPRRVELRLWENAEWPNLKVCRALPQDKVVLARIYLGGYPAIMGNFFGGAAAPVRRWCDAFYQCLEQRAQKGAFIHSDEYMMQSCWKRRPELAYLLPSRHVPWLWLVSLLCRLAGKEISGHRWYFLSGKRFPWKYFWGRIFSGAGR